MPEHKAQFEPAPAWQPPTCEECGSDRLEDCWGHFGTGVYAPDGYEENWWYDGVRCLDCGHFETWT